MAVYNPGATYRLQFNKDFTFADAKKIVPYLEKLGIGAVYASPVFKAVSGSMHGYDVTDPNQVNPEIGTEQEFEKLSKTLHAKGIGWIQDIVPNHMSYSPENPWVYDVLKHGQASRCYRYFDIIDDHFDKRYQQRIQLPFFGKPVDELLEANELSIDVSEQGFRLCYFDNRYPLSPISYRLILDDNGSGDMPEEVARLRRAQKPEKIEEQFARMWEAGKENSAMKQYVDGALERINSDPRKLRELIDEQHYIPVCWRETEKIINYRRFFTINSLICLNMQDEEVFNTYHARIKLWLDQGLINGVRVDHVDGLYDPAQYLQWLRRLCGEEAWIGVEKILEEGEQVDVSWPIQGTTGYDFLGAANSLFTEQRNKKLFHEHYLEWQDEKASFEDMFYSKKHFILYHRLQGELDNLTTWCLRLAPVKKQKPDSANLKKALGAFLIGCPVYKIYSPPSRFGKQERTMVENIIKEAIRFNELLKPELYLLKKLFIPGSMPGKKELAEIDHFFMRCMQFTGPLMAKGIEDTAFYVYNPFIVHNEVGDTPGHFGLATGAFHNDMVQRQRQYPLTMNTTSTHDTKRGEDARARLNVISSIPKRWMEVTAQWHQMNREFRTIDQGHEIPTRNDEYHIYQALCAHFPLQDEPDESFVARLKEYLLKALREGKENSSWSDPDTGYEDKVFSFVEKIVDKNTPFIKSLENFMLDLIPAGINNAVSQVILKNTAPGVPDTFQGCEGWNFSFVDPDNRRPVDYKVLSERLDKMIREEKKSPGDFLKQLWSTREDGRLKQWMHYQTIQARSRNPELFARGDYVPLKVTGSHKNDFIAFCRVYRDDYFVCVLPLNNRSVDNSAALEKTFVRLPGFAPYKFRNLLTNSEFKGSGKIPLSILLNQLPFAMCEGIPFQPGRKAGVLMHITSLPSKYGIGDVGEEARAFVDFLSETGQRYWQILPLNLSNHQTGYSPYSALSAFAGNTLLIDPERLVDHGFIKRDDLKRYKSRREDHVNYPWAEKARTHLLEKAYDVFQKSGSEELVKRFNTYKEREAKWLDDFALFMVIKGRKYEQSWDKWPGEYRDRDPALLKKFEQAQQRAIEQVKFNQFIFSEQWQELKSYANGRGVDIIGDIPIYVSYDSADVWAHPELFDLNSDKSMRVVAGVPPDYFNANGQLWGMPLFNWERMAKDEYHWWLQRIGKNLQWFDLLRLDHFRGFSAYWEVLADAETALGGQWVPGPAYSFFDRLKQEFPDLPLIAEDLGQIDQPVFDLRDAYELPGMKVVQFGFGDNMAFSQHVPINHTYNSLAYTGTHDNNTIRGWFRQEADKATKNRFRQYTGVKLKEKNCSKAFIRQTYASVAKIVIVQMQDWFDLDERSRMNFPSTTEGNWLWWAVPSLFTSKLKKRMRRMVKLFGRY